MIFAQRARSCFIRSVSRSGGPPTPAQREAYRARVDREAAAIILQDELDSRPAVRYASPARSQRTETSP